MDDERHVYGWKYHKIKPPMCSAQIKSQFYTGTITYTQHLAQTKHQDKTKKENSKKKYTKENGKRMCSTCA